MGATAVWSRDGCVAIEKFGKLGIIPGGGATRGVAQPLHEDAEAVHDVVLQLPWVQAGMLIALLTDFPSAEQLERHVPAIPKDGVKQVSRRRRPENPSVQSIQEARRCGQKGKLVDALIPMADVAILDKCHALIQVNLPFA